MLKSEKLLLAGVFLISSLTPGLYGQGPVKPEQRAEILTEITVRELGLPSLLIQKVYSLNYRYVLKNDSVNRVHRGDSEMTRFYALQKIQELKHEEIRELLNPEQFRLYEEKKWLIQKLAVDRMEMIFYEKKLGITVSQAGRIENLNEKQNLELAEISRDNPGRIEVYLFFRQAGREKKALQQEIFTEVQLRILEESRSELRGGKS